MTADETESTHYQMANFFTKMAESYPKLVENTVGKGEIARYEQFLLFTQCFQKACFPGASKGVIVWEWVKECRNLMTMRCYDISYIDCRFPGVPIFAVHYIQSSFGYNLTVYQYFGYR